MATLAQHLPQQQLPGEGGAGKEAWPWRAARISILVEIFLTELGVGKEAAVWAQIPPSLNKF